MLAFITLLAISLLSLTATSPRLGRIAAWLAPLGAIAALAIHLYSEELLGSGGLAADRLAYPQALGEPPYTIDALTAVVGAWCLLLGAVILLSHAYRVYKSSTHDALRPGLTGTTLALLYAAIHTTNLLAFAMELLVLVALLWAMSGAGKDVQPAYSAHSTLALGLGALCVLAAALVVGRTTGGVYSLSSISLSALTPGTLVLVALGVALWAGLIPFTAWSTRVSGIPGLLLRAMVSIIPAVVLVLRLEQLVTNRGFAGTTPDGWAAFTSLLLWAGALTAIIAGAAAWVHAGTSRCLAALSASAAGLCMWGLGLDTPAGRYAAVAIALAVGAGVVALWLADLAGARILAWYSLIALGGGPLTATFVGIWLLGAAVTETGRASSIVPLLGAVIMACMGAAAHAAFAVSLDRAANPPPGLTSIAGASAALASLVVLAGGVVPAAWLPLAASVAMLGGGSISGASAWYGLQEDNSAAPLLLLAVGALVIALVGRLIGAWMRSGAVPGTVLLPPAIARIGLTPTLSNTKMEPSANRVPAPVWWLSFEWLDEGVWGLGVLLGRLSSMAGVGLGRLEGRYYLPLALLLVMAAILAITR